MPVQSRLLRSALLAIALFAFSAADARALKYCKCVAATNSWSSGIVHDYGTIASYKDLDTRAPRKCSRACSDLVSGKSGMGDATALCSATGWAGGCVRGYGYIGRVGTNNADGTAGLLVCNRPQPAVTQQRCPQGWLANPTNEDGGVTVDGKCKRLVCSSLPRPLPPDGTPLGTWGFSWGNGLWQWGPPQTVTTAPAKPGSGSWSTCR